MPCISSIPHTYIVYSNLCQVQTFGDHEIHGHDYPDFPRGPTQGFATWTSPRRANRGCQPQPSIPPPRPPKPRGDITRNTTKTKGVRINDTCRNLKMLQNQILFSASNSSVICFRQLRFGGELFFIEQEQRHKHQVRMEKWCSKSTEIRSLKWQTGDNSACN